MVKCSECNTELEENAKFCPDCGAKVEIIEAEVVNEETQAIRGTKFWKDLEEQNEVLRKQLEAQAVSMQREMDEQKEQYEKKIRHVESVNSALSSQVLDIQNQLDNLANANDLKRIQEYISGHELVEKYNLASTIIGYYKEDVKKEDFTGVTDYYIEDLITMAFNTTSAFQSTAIRENIIEMIMIGK